MINFFRNLKISSTSFWLGFLSGILFAWLLSRLRIYIPQLIRSLRKRLGAIRENLSTGTESRYRNEIYYYSQKQHLAASMFSLDEIVIEPRVLTPLNQLANSMEIAPSDSVSTTLPYIPDWPEMAVVYKASTMSFLEALQGGGNIVLTGHPGSGKSVALAWLSSCIARNDPRLGKLAGLLPLYIHATDLTPLIGRSENISVSQDTVDIDNVDTKVNQSQSVIKDANQAIDLIIDAISHYSSPITLTRLPRIVHAALQFQHAILIIDRVDELPPHQASAITSFIKILLEKYPKLRIVVAMSYDNLAGLPTLGLNLLALASWTNEERSIFIKRWSKQWAKWVVPLEKSDLKKINSYFINSWLSVNNSLLMPLELTLKVWSAFSGDILGDDGTSAIEAYLRRMTGSVTTSRAGLESFALQLLVEMGITSKPSDVTRLKSEYEEELKSPSSDETAELIDPSQSIQLHTPVIKNIRGIDTLTENGLLLSYPDARFGFSHHVFTGYLAGKALADSGVLPQIQSQPLWTGKTLALHYLARFGDVSPLVQYFLQEDDLLHTNHLLVSRWLQVAPKNRAWRTIILRTLTTILEKEKETLSLAAKIIAAMAFSGDIGVSQYFRQLISSDHPNLKQLAALGCGIVNDKKSIESLNQLLQEPSPASIRAASLALGAIGDKQALEILASNLLNGNELVRRCAAEALANEPKEGYRALKDGSEMEDVLVRRSVVYGLIRVNQSWATKIVENIQLEDGEWVVRNAAIQAFEELHQKSRYAPQPLPDLTETSWLSDYAQKHGTTVAPGKPAEDLVSKAFINGTDDEKLNAIDYLRSKCDPKTMKMILSTYLNSTGELRDASYFVLWLMTISGIKLPLTFD